MNRPLKPLTEKQIISISKILAYNISHKIPYDLSEYSQPTIDFIRQVIFSHGYGWDSEQNNQITEHILHNCSTSALIYIQDYLLATPRLVGIELNPGPTLINNKMKHKNKDKTKRKNKPKKQNTGSKLLKQGGRALGSIVGLGNLGASVGSTLSHVLGMGAYHVNSNSIMNSSTQAPNFGSGNTDVILEHTEFITDVVSTTTFASRSFMIDPSDPNIFPYLSSVAQNFEQYEFLGLVYTYKPTSGSAIASTNNALGTIMLTTEYDVSRPEFINKVDMESYQFATSCEPCGSMYHPVECKPNKDVVNIRYMAGPYRQQKTSTYNTSGTKNIQNNLQYLGRTQLATVGSQGINTVGELWVSYKIRLITPKRIGPSNIQGFYHIVSSSNVPVGSTTALASSFNVVTDSTRSLSPVDFTVSGTNSVLSLTGVQPKTQVIVNLSYKSLSGLTSQPNFTGTSINTSNMFFLDIAGNGSSSTFTPALQTSQNVQYCFITTDTSLISPCNIIIPAPTVTVAETQWDITLYIVPNFLQNKPNIAPYVTSALEEAKELNDKIRELEKFVLDLKGSKTASLMSTIEIDYDEEEKKEYEVTTPVRRSASRK